MSGECVISLVLSHNSKNLKRRMLKPSERTCLSSQIECVTALSFWTDHVTALGQISVTALCYSSVLQLRVMAQFYLENKRKIHPRGMLRACWPKRLEEKRESPSPLAPLLIYFFLPLGLTYVNSASQECFVLPEVLLQSLDFPLFCFCGLFPSLSFSHCHSRLLFPILTI